MGFIVLLVSLMLIGTQSALAQSGGSPATPSSPATGGSAAPDTGAAAVSSGSSSGSSGSYSSSGGYSTGGTSTGADMWLYAAIGTTLISSGFVLRRVAGKRA